MAVVSASAVQLLELWVVVSISVWLAGYVILVVRCFRVREERERRRLRMLASGLILVWLIGIHNIVVRRWGAVLGDTAPALLSATGLVAEALVFSFVVLMLDYTLIKHRHIPSRM